MPTDTVPEDPFWFDPREAVDAAVAGFTTRDGAIAVAVTALRAVVAVGFTSWLLRRFGRRQAIATTFVVYGAAQALARGCTWAVRKAATHDNPPEWAKVPPWAVLTDGERRQLITAATTRIRR